MPEKVTCGDERSQQVTCGEGCGATRFVVWRAGLNSGWIWHHDSVTLTEFRAPGYSDSRSTVAYCPRCGARLSFDAQGGPVVEAQDAAIARAVAEERHRCAIHQCAQCAMGRTRTWTGQVWVHYIAGQHKRCGASSIWGPPDPAQEEASDGE